MTYNDALHLLADLVAANDHPALTLAEIERELRSCKTADSHGRYADDPSWTPSYDPYAAAARLWELKASRVASEFDFSSDDTDYTRSQLLAHCRSVAKLYRARTFGHIGPGVK